MFLQKSPNQGICYCDEVEGPGGDRGISQPSIAASNLLDNNSGGDLVNMSLDEVKYMGSDLRFELGLLERLAQYMPSALDAWSLDNSQIEDVEKPKKELQDLLSLVVQHQPFGEKIGTVTKSNTRRCNLI